MNPLIDILSVWGDRFVLFAGPMLLQSSLLIGVLFLIDLAIRRHVRAVTLHALWLLLPLKLLLPPDLSAPTGIGYWLGTERIPAGLTPMAPATVRIEADFPNGIHDGVAEQEAATPGRTGTAWLLVGWAVGSIVLFVLVRRRSRLIRRRIDAAVQPPAKLTALMEACRRQLELRQSVELRLVDGFLSPSVCGWRKPVVLIPRHLVERLSDPQLRSVLLHELAHVRRGDVLVNALQTLLQIVYWWNPLLWLANAHIRHLRETAVDELVVVTLGSDAPTYPETLIEVARAACTRPASTLGLIGIVETGGALKLRIALLLEREVPRHATLGFAPTLGIVLAGVLLLPMARGQQELAEQADASVQVSGNQTSVVRISVWLVELPEAALTELRFGEPFVRATNGHVAWLLTSDQLSTVNQQVKNRAGTIVLASPRVTTQSGKQTRIEVVNPMAVDGVATPTHGGLLTSACVLTPEVDGAQIDLSISANITESGSVAPGPNGQFEFRLPENKTPGPAQPPAGVVYAVNAIGYMLYDVGTARVSVRDGGGIVLQNPNLKNSRGNKYLVVVAPRIERSPERAGPASAGQAPDPLRAAGPATTNEFETRIYTLNAARLRERLRAATGQAEGVRADTLVYSYLRSLGISTNPPRALFFNDRAMRLYLMAPREDLDRVTEAIEQLEPFPVQILIESSFVELPAAVAEKLGLDLPPVFLAPVQWKRVLTAPEMKRIMTAAGQLAGTSILAAPRVATQSGRQAQIQVTELRSVVTGIKPDALSEAGIQSTNGLDAALLVTSIPTGPRLDLFPTVAEDGHTIGLAAMATYNQFLGYDGKDSDNVRIRVDGKDQTVTVPMTRFLTSRMQAEADVLDGQTLVLGCPRREVETKRWNGKSKRADVPEDADKRLLVFVTPTIVNSSSHRVHPPGKVPPTSDEIPRSNSQQHRQ